MILNAAGMPLTSSEQKAAVERAQGIFNITLQAAGLARAELNDVITVATNLILHAFAQISKENESKFIAEVVGNMHQAFTHAANEKEKLAAQQAQIKDAIKEAVGKPT